MTTRYTIGTLGVFVSLLMLAYGCQSDRSYRDEYIELLEERIDIILDSPEKSGEIQLTQKDVLNQVVDAIDFACGSDKTIRDIRVRKNAPTSWSVLVELNTDSIDDYGFPVTTKILLEGEENLGILEISNINNLIEACY
tara:strand:+ start:1113 stop:1529 length:417 start_codon:yes stop_codon:yes gene_type:complete